jgi:hypothetical protein
MGRRSEFEVIKKIKEKRSTIEGETVKQRKMEGL